MDPPSIDLQTQMSTHKWNEVREHPGIRRVYPDEVWDADSIPFQIRDFLGDYLLQITETHTADPYAQKKWVMDLARYISDTDTQVHLLWIGWLKLSSTVLKRPHGMRSLYHLMFVEMANERKYSERMKRELVLLKGTQAWAGGMIQGVDLNVRAELVEWSSKADELLGRGYRLLQLRNGLNTGTVG